MADEFVLESETIPKTTQNNTNDNINLRKENARGNNISSLMADRHNNPPSQEELQKFQNRLMGRSENFSKLPKEEKEKIMFQELQNWYFDSMPSIDDMKKELEKNPLTCEVNSLNPEDTKGINNQHINLKSQNVRLTVVSDGKTITFNNDKLLSEYRAAVKKENEKKNDMSDVKKRGQELHDYLVFE